MTPLQQEQARARAEILKPLQKFSPRGSGVTNDLLSDLDSIVASGNDIESFFATL